MKAKKYGITISVFLISFTLIIAIILEIYSCSQFLVNILLGVIGSGFVTLVIYISDYNVERRNALESYYLCINDLIREFNKIVYFDIRPPADLVGQYFHEEFVKNIYKDNEESNKKQMRLIEYFINEYKSLDLEESSDLKKMAKERLEIESIKYTEKLNKTIDSYLAISDYNVASLDVAYGNIDFIFGNRSFRKWIYNDTYCFVREKLNEIINMAYNFRMYCKNEGGSKGVLIKIIGEFQLSIFETETEENDFQSIYKVKPSFKNILYNRAEVLRAKMYNEKKNEVVYEDYVLMEVKIKQKKP